MFITIMQLIISTLISFFFVIPGKALIKRAATKTIKHKKNKSFMIYLSRKWLSMLTNWNLLSNQNDILKSGVFKICTRKVTQT